jgi:hypothetical protein
MRRDASGDEGDRHQREENPVHENLHLIMREMSTALRAGAGVREALV